jgi:hypothetical protein
MSIIYYAIFLHLAVGIYAYGASSIFPIAKSSYIPDSLKGITSNVGSSSGNKNISLIFRRYLYTPWMTVLLLLMIIYWLI